jgi:hypothetical protein
MTISELYRKHIKGEIARSRFLYEARRDQNLPWITNVTSYDDAIQILKNKGLIKEAATVDPIVDRVNPYHLKKGVEKILSKETQLTNDSYINALNKAAKQLAKNPHAFDEDMFHNAETVKKMDANLKMQPVKANNLKDKANEMKKIKGHTNAKANTTSSTKENRKTKKPKGVQIMKENVIDRLLEYLKKSNLTEDTHYHHTVGAEVHTPDGPGNIVEILGSTLTVEMQDGTQRDYQINVIDAAEKAYAENKTESKSVEEAAIEENIAENVDRTAAVMKAIQDMEFTGIDFNEYARLANQSNSPEEYAQAIIDYHDSKDEVVDDEMMQNTKDFADLVFNVSGTTEPNSEEGDMQSWIDPAGGTHYSDDEDPTDLYKEHSLASFMEMDQDEEDFDDQEENPLPPNWNGEDEDEYEGNDENPYFPTGGDFEDIDEELDEAQKFKVSGETIFKNDTEAISYEEDLKKARVKYIKSSAK